jgi:chromatin remodeling complex protein RSC6
LRGLITDYPAYNADAPACSADTPACAADTPAASALPRTKEEVQRELNELWTRRVEVTAANQYIYSNQGRLANVQTRKPVSRVREAELIAEFKRKVLEERRELEEVDRKIEKKKRKAEEDDTKQQPQKRRRSQPKMKFSPVIISDSETEAKQE